jgi:hypothetical protein
MSVKLACCTCTWGTPRAAPKRSSHAESRGCGLNSSEMRSAAVSRHQPITRSTNRASYGAFVGVFPATSTSGRPGSSP